jgi:hypothetical protein
MKNENGFTNRYKRVPGTLLLRKKFVQIGISLTHLFHITIVSYCNNLTNRENGSDPENQQIIEAQVTKKTGNCEMCIYYCCVILFLTFWAPELWDILIRVWMVLNWNWAFLCGQDVFGD